MAGVARGVILKKRQNSVLGELNIFFLRLHYPRPGPVQSARQTIVLDRAGAGLNGRFDNRSTEVRTILQVF
jgi:hypothetical protein